ncbi:MAG: M23 family metallopeptidase [bacterium]
MKLKRPSRLDKIRLIFFSTSETEFRQFEFSLQRVLMYLLLVAVGVGCIFMGSVSISNKLYQNNTNSSLAKTNHYLKKKIKSLQSSVENLNNKLVVLEEDTEDLEVLVGLTSTDVDSQNIHLLSNKDLVMASMPVDYEYQADKMSKYLAALEARVQRATAIQGVIEDKFLHTQKKIKHIPSIKPVLGARITDKFGIRKDPFVERVKHHNGVDLAARYGTKIYSAADGVVEFTRKRYRLNKGYGRVVIINHGFGYKTLYGHLSKVLVKPGQRVKRWEQIGLSGDTGRATGPHLHYEVWLNGGPQNPEDYILD